MKIVRTIVWVLLLVALVIFSVNNWNPVEVKIWEGLVLETKIPALVIIAFLIGLVPMWLLHRATRWNNERRIASLENAARASAMVAPVAPVDPVAPLARESAPPPAPEPPLAPAVQSPREEPRTDLSPEDEPKPAP
jgi:lipopolysaccharide assembly protein A